MKILAFCLLLTFSYFAQAQQTKQFRDSYGLQGEVKYSGQWSDSFMPTQGPYELKWRDIEGEKLKTYQAKGNLKNALPEGKWTWEEAAWTYTIEPGRNLQPAFNSSGFRSAWESTFLQGTAHGHWKFTQDSLIAGTKTSALLEILAQYNKGQLVGKFQVKDNRDKKKIRITGECDAMGEAHGAWEIQYQANDTSLLIVERRIYQNGVLIKEKLEYPKLDSIIFDQSYDQVIQQLASFKTPQGESSLQARVGSKKFSDDGARSAGLKKVVDYLNGQMGRGWQLDLFKHRFESNGPIFRKLEYPLSLEETMQIRIADSLARRTRMGLAQRMNYRNILINRGRSQELDLAVSFVQMGLEKLSIADSLLNLTKGADFTYINRRIDDEMNWQTAFNQNLRLYGHVYDTVFVDFPLYDKLASAKVEVFADMINYLETIASLAKVHFNVMDNAFLSLQKEGDLQELEDQLATKLTKCEELYEGLEGTGEVIRLVWVDTYLKELFQEYSQTDDYVQSMQIGMRIGTKLDSLIAWTPFWRELDSMAYNLLEQYTHFAYNPYTGKHDIEIRLKKRFYNKVATAFWPWMLQRVKTEKDWDGFVQAKALTIAAYDRLMAFALEEGNSAKRLDKRVRDEKSMERILKLLTD